MKTMKLFAALFAAAVSQAAFAQETQKYELSPARQPIVEETSRRSHIILNGVWEFSPAPQGATATLPADGAWGTSLVPGFWRTPPGKPGILKEPPALSSKEPLKRSIGGWYRRKIEIPQEWDGKTVILQMRHISNNARVFVNGKFVSDIRDHGGEADLTDFVKAGETASVEILVCTYSGENDFDAVLKGSPAPKKGYSAGGRGGIGGDVLLRAMPRGARIDGVFVRTKVSDKTISADIDLRDVDKFSAAEFKAKIFSASGECVKTFSGKSDLDISREQTVAISAPWEDPILWDTDNPYLYTLEISFLRGGKTLDVFRQRFGFREFSIKVRDFYLNGKKIHLRPLHCFVEGEVGGSREAIANNISAMLKNNYNTLEFWPWDHFDVNAFHLRPVWTEIADEKGLLIFYPYYGQGGPLWKWEDTAAREKFKAHALKQWREIRNSPSVVSLIGFPNCASTEDDQNPLKIGNWNNLAGDASWYTAKDYIRKAISWLKVMEPTRPISIHHGANIGDFQTMNHYLDFIPLQEREEWMSEWSESGTMPYMAIEFGTPFICNFQRNRQGPYRAWYSEPLLAEFAAPYLGERAYGLETDEYRNMISKQYVGERKWNKLVDLHEFAFAPAMGEFQALFIRNTWRSFRTWGVSGGMVPWRDGYGWVPVKGNVKLPYKDGALGWQGGEIPARGYYGMEPRGAVATLSGKALAENQIPALMWIVGADAFTDKTHHFYGGEKLSKQIALVNDLRQNGEYDLKWSVQMGGKRLGGGEFKGSVRAGEKIFLPIGAVLSEVSEKTRGEIAVEGEFGGARARDAFAFTVYPRAQFPNVAKLSVFDPEGTTEAILNKFNVNFKRWDGSPCGGVLIIGENAFDKPLQGSISEFVENGGKLLILGQKGETLEKECGLRVSKFVSRRIFVTRSQLSHPLVSGLDSEDFRDWAGSTTRVPAYGGIGLNPSKGQPEFGWHWGNRGGVASAAIEKPHYSGWRPILECEFDLSFTPLAEKEFGKGRAVFCALDLAGRTARDPVADEMFARLLSYLDKSAPAQAAADSFATYVGGARGARMLKDFGMYFKEAKTLPSSGFAVIGEDSGLTDEQLKSAMENGVNMLVIEGGKPRFGLTVKDGKIGRLAEVPNWREAAGISLGEVHTRTDIPAKLFEGGETGAGGNWAKVSFGKGTAVLVSLLPDELDTKAKFYLRFTAWRMSAAISKLAGNLGARFKFDKVLLEPDANYVKTAPVALAGAWKFSWESDVKGNPQEREFDDSAWGISILHEHADQYGLSRVPYEKPYWVRKRFVMPEDWSDSKITLSLGRIVGGDDVYVNGKRVATTPKHRDTWTQDRNYEIPSSAFVFGKLNTISLRVDPYSSGRVIVGASELGFNRTAVESAYSKDYRTDKFEGDSPFRYVRW